MSMADRIAVMNEGRVEQLGTPVEIYKRPASRFVADFIGDSNFFAAELDGGVAVLRDGTRVGCRGGSGRATLMVRPESIRIAAPGAAPVPAIRGRVVQTSFLGSFVRVAVTSPATEGLVIAALQGPDAEHLPDVEREVELWWAEEDAVVLGSEETLER